MEALLRTQLSDDGVSYVWDPDQTTKAFNDAQELIVRALRLTESNATTTNTSNHLIPKPADAIEIDKMYASKITGGAMPLLAKTTIKFEDLKDPSWRDKTGTPARWAEQDGNTLRIIPAPAANVDVTVGYLQRPVPMTAPSSTPDVRIPEYYHDPLKYAAAAYLLAMNGPQKDLERSNLYMQMFVSQVKRIS